MLVCRPGNTAHSVPAAPETTTDRQVALTLRSCPHFEGRRWRESKTGGSALMRSVRAARVSMIAVATLYLSFLAPVNRAAADGAGPSVETEPSVAITSPSPGFVSHGAVTVTAVGRVDPSSEDTPTELRLLLNGTLWV